jgi:hypothetical protein
MSRSWIAGCLIFAAGAATPALANGAFPKVTNETVLYECGDCHMVYQPQMLPKRSWRKLMDGFADHFGEELDLDDETRGEVLGYLLAKSADGSTKKKGRRFLRGLGPGDAPIRITDTPRWRKKHRELPDRVWADPRVEFKGQCEVCHTQAERGRYDDDDVRVPGPKESWRRWDDD